MEKTEKRDAVSRDLEWWCADGVAIYKDTTKNPRISNMGRRVGLRLETGLSH